MRPAFASIFVRLAALSALTPLAPAQSFTFTLESATSATNIGALFTIDLPSTAIGDYDAATNPTGTKTCTNLFGTCNNTAIPFTNSLEIDSSLVGSPSGSFLTTIDVASGVAIVSGFNAAPLGKQSGGAELTLNLLYSTFRTQQPDSLYIGGINLPLPLGQVTVDNVLLTQSGDAAGLLTAGGASGVYDFAALLNTTLEFDVDFLGNATHVGPLPFPLPVVGVLDLNGPTALLSLSVDQSAKQTIADPLGGQTFTGVAVPLPTILPPGGTANLLFDLTPGDLDLSFLADLDWVANGVGACDVASYCRSTPNTYSNGAAIGANGSTSLFFNSFTLTATGVPPAHAGRFAMSRQQGSMPFGDGTLCLAGVVRRYPIVLADTDGVATYTVDFGDVAQPGWLITAGSTWNFQLIFRDPIGGPLTFNTSNAIQATFCP